MRVLHIGKFFPPHPGGIERISADLCLGLAEHGVTTAIIAHAEPGTHRRQSRRCGNLEVELAACHGQWLFAPVSPGFPRLLSRTIRRFRPDLLHVHLPNTSAFWALLLPAARAVPWIVHWHADIPLDSRHLGLRLAYRLYRPWEQALLRRARAVIATSEPYMTSSAAVKPWRSKTVVIPLGLPPVDRFGPPSEDDTGTTVAGSADPKSQAETPPPHPALSPIANDGGEGLRGDASTPTTPPSADHAVAGAPATESSATRHTSAPSPIVNDEGKGLRADISTPSPPTASGERAGVRGQRPIDPTPQQQTLSVRSARLSIDNEAETVPSDTDETASLPRVASDPEDVHETWPAPGLRLLAVGRLSYFKGFDVLLRALARVADASLVLIGDGERRDALRRLADELRVAHRVDFAGRLDMDTNGAGQLARSYAEADLFCLPSTERAESFGLVLLEAMRAGLPVVASDIPGSGTGYVVCDGETGLLTPPGDVAALAEAIRHLAADPALRQRLGAAGRQRWEREFTLERSLQRTLELYRLVLRTDHC